jgi:hypothetical protein
VNADGPPEIRERDSSLVDMQGASHALGLATSSPPPVETFVETWDIGPWTPYNDVPGSALGEIEERCAQVPDERYDRSRAYLRLIPPVLRCTNAVLSGL